MNTLFQDIFTGLMLGDGSIVKPATNAWFGQTCRHKIYLNFVMDFMSKNGFTYAENAPYLRQGKSPRWSFTTHVNTYFTEQYLYWYPNGEKHIPYDIVLSPNTCLHWYIGDGCLCYGQDKYSRGINFATQCFSLNDCFLLQNKMEDLGFPIIRRENGSHYMKKKSAKRFLEYIGSCPCLCYEYKWTTNNKELYKLRKSTCLC